MINLDDRQWKQFRIKELFKPSFNGKGIAKKNRHSGNIPYAGAPAHNNGIVQFVNPGSIKPLSYFIGVNGNGNGVGYTFYHSYNICVSGDVRILLPKKAMNKYVAWFICTCIRQQRHQFSFGYKLTCSRLDNLLINLPISNANTPDWEFMMDYIKQTRHEIPYNYIHDKINHPKYSLRIVKWNQFKIKDLFTIIRGKRIPKRCRHKGIIPFIGASTENNGMTDTINKQGRNEGYHRNVIGVNYNGAPGYAFYHPYLAYFSDDVIVLTRHNLTWPIALFITTAIRQQRHQFNYGFKLKEQWLKNLKINLPITSKGTPNWKFMFNYMTSLIN